MCSRFRLKLVCSLSRLSHLHHPLCLHLSWSPGINPHLRISPVGVDPSAVPSSPNYPFRFPPRAHFYLQRKIKTPTCKSSDEERRREGGSCRGRREKRRGIYLRCERRELRSCSAVHHLASSCFPTSVLSPLTLISICLCRPPTAPLYSPPSTLISHFHPLYFPFSGSLTIFRSSFHPLQQVRGSISYIFSK